MKNWTTFKKELFKDPKFAQEYKALDSQYQIATQLIELRLSKRLSQKELAQKVGTHQSAIARLESGNYNPSLKFLKKIAEATGAQLKIEFQN